MLVDVALPVPLFRSFTYEVDDAEGHRARRGMRAVVPFHARKLLGVILGPAEPREGMKVKRVAGLPDQAPVISDSLLGLADWMSRYYVVPIGIVLRTILPVALTGAADPTPTRKTRRVLAITRSLESLLERDQLFARAKQQRAVYEYLEALGGRAAIASIREHLHVADSVLSGLVARGIAAIETETVARDPFATRDSKAKHHRPSPAQREAIDRLAALSPGDVALVHGITGSGKTLVYLELLKTIVRERGQTAIVLVPEIALTPQTVDRFRAVFGNDVAVLHSALSDGERYDAWLSLQRGERRIAVGARSAIFAPLERLGAIIIDEEHEATYKQGEAPRYHARDVATVRARAEGAIVVLGSATPSLESWKNAQDGKYALVSLPDRVGGASLPRVEVVDRRAALRQKPDGQPIEPFRMVVGEELEAAIQLRLAKKEQTILLLNRRGYASFIQCGACGFVATCPNCSISLTYHRTTERLICHYCLHEEALPGSCPRCAGAIMRQRGLGTQQVERLLGERYPSARIARMDVDTTSGKWAHAEILDRVGAGEVDILLGTQMIAKGLDFANVTLVGVVDADVGINLPDFRASERCYQLLSQVAGRAGRGPKGGEVLIQTRVPNHHAVRCAVTHDYERFATEEIKGRTDPPYPPFIRLANVVFSGPAENEVAALAEAGSVWLHQLISRRSIAGVTVIGPAPCPIERIKNRWRWHVLIKSETPAELTRVGRFFVERFDAPGENRVTFDREPVSLL
ncbi:MAG TPA: primosomal protein N' [Gemmatimonadaceae bacterium]|nr:primosomal protein N' [Gemmatimonadaceae bacterium]